MTETVVRFQKDNEPPHDLDGWQVVWSDRLGEYIAYDPYEFMEVWRDIHTVWMDKIGRSCLAFGCGRDTFACWVHDITGRWYRPNYLRMILEIGVALEWAIPNQPRYSCFNLRPIRYEELL